MSDRHTNPSGLRPSVRTDDLEISTSPESPDEDQEPRPTGPGPQRPAPSGAFRSKPRDTGPIMSRRPASSGVDDSGEQQITLPDTEAARRKAGSPPSGEVGQSGEVDLRTLGGTDRDALGDAGVGTFDAPGAGASGDMDLRTSGVSDGGPRSLDGDPLGEGPADSPSQPGVGGEGAPATAAIALPDTEAARQPAASSATGGTPVFASRRERKLYETGAIGFPVADPKTAASKTDSAATAGITVQTAGPSPDTSETATRRRLGFRKAASGTAPAGVPAARPGSENTPATGALAATEVKRRGFRRSEAEVGAATTPVDNPAGSGAPAATDLLEISTGTATAPNGLAATTLPLEPAPASDVLETPARRKRLGLRESDETDAPKPASERPSFFALLSQVLPRVLAVLIAVAGIVLLAVGGLKATVWAPSDVVVGELGAHSANFVTAEVGVLSLSGPRLQVRVSGTGSDPVFVGIGRASDVDAYLGDAAADRIVGLNKDTGKLITRSQGSDSAAVLDPASADVWSVSALGQGSATLTWPEPASGQWRLVISTDGARAAPQNVTLTWSGTQPSNPAPAWIAVGVVLLVAGVIVSMMLRARSRDRRRA